MTPKRKAISKSSRRPQPLPSIGTGPVNCAYVTNWPAWFEIDKGGYRRTGGLEFVRLFVSAGGTMSTESSQFLQLLCVLRTISPDRYHHNLGIYFGLVSLTATLQRCYRGWLLDEACKPLTDKGMARRLFADLKTMRQAVKDLLESGLIQRLPLPQFDPTADDAEDRERKKAQGDKGRRQKKAERPGKPARAAGICKHLQTFANGAERFAGNTELTTDKIKKEILNGQQVAKAKLKAKGKAQSQGPPEGQASTSPPAAPPEGQKEKPQEVTAGQRRHSQPSGRRQPATAARGVSPGPTILPLHQNGDATPIGQMLPRAVDGLAQGFLVRAPEFSREIFNLLGPPFDRESRDGVRELANYVAAVRDAVDAGLTAAQMEELLGKARRDAGNIGKHRKRYYRRDGSPEQYWRFLFNKHLGTRRSAGPPARAGPSAAGVG